MTLFFIWKIVPSASRYLLKEFRPYSLSRLSLFKASDARASDSRNPAHDYIPESKEKNETWSKSTINKRSTIFVPSSWNFVKMIISGGDYFHQVSWGSDKKCGFYINGQFLNVSCFLSSDFTINIVWKHVKFIAFLSVSCTFNALKMKSPLIAPHRLLGIPHPLPSLAT